MRIIAIPFVLAATPALAAEGAFFTLTNTNFVVMVAFLLFVGVLVYLKVPGILAGMLDKRAAGIRAELDEAKALHEEAQTILAGYERKKVEVEELAERIVERAKVEAEEAAEAAKAALAASIDRRLRAAQDQIASAQTAAVREVRDRAIEIAVAAAGQVMASSMTEKAADDMIGAAMAEIGDRLH